MHAELSEFQGSVTGVKRGKWRKVLIKAGLGAAVVVAVAVLVWLVRPSPIDPVSWQPPEAPEEAGVYAENLLLRNAERLADGQLFHPEDIVFDAEGRLYTGTQDGKIHRITFDERGGVQSVEVFAETGGYPLGLHFDRNGQLIAAVKSVGLVAIDRQGKVTLLTDRAGDTPIQYADELDIASDGTIYFSDGSTKFEWGWPFDTLEGRPYGRLLRYNPATRETEVLLDGLYFANGILLSAEEDYLLITESPRYRITRYWLRGDKAGTTEPFAENLPILPDNLSIDHEGDIWVGGSKRSGLLDRLQRHAFLKRQLSKLPFDWLRGLPEWESNRYGYVIRLAPTGEVKRTYQDPGGENVYAVSSIERRGDELYIGTLYGQAVARYKLDEAGGSR